MKKIFTKLFDPTLTPGSAALKDYEYIDDIVVSMKSAKQSTQMFLKLLVQHHLKLGIPNTSQNEYFGLYVPFKELDKISKLAL